MMVLQNTAIGDGTINLQHQYGFELHLLDKYLGAPLSGTDPKMAVKFDLNFNFDSEPGNKCYLEIEYATRLFKKERIDRYFEAFIHIVTQVLADPEIALSRIEIISKAEKQRVLEVFNAPVDAITEQSINELLGRSFETLKDKPALIAGDTVLSYQQLADRAAIVSAYLSQARETNEHSFVGLLMERSEWMLISILGILQSGPAQSMLWARYARRATF